MRITKQCVLVGPGPQAEGQTGVTYAAGISSATAGVARAGSFLYIPSGVPHAVGS